MFFISKKAFEASLATCLESALRKVFLGETEQAKLVRLGQECDKLKQEIESSNKILAKTKLDHEIELQEITFLETKKDEMAKIEKEKATLELEKKAATHEVALAKKEAELQNTYFAKTEKMLQDFRAEANKTFDTMLQRITLEITKDKVSG